MSAHNEHLPIKVIIPAEGDIHPPRRNKPRPTDFTKHYDAARDAVLSGLDSVARHFEPCFLKTNLPAVARVTLRSEAIAKSHRPTSLFDERTCPIIGAEYFGHLLISVRPGMLERLTQKIRSSGTRYVRNDVSKIESITPFTREDVFGSWTVESFLSYMREHKQRSFKVRVFDHRDSRAAEALIQHLIQLASSMNLRVPERLPYCARMAVFDFDASHADHVMEVAGFVGTQGIAVYEDFKISTNTVVRGPMSGEHLPPPDKGVDYPVVGLFDTGTDRNNPHVQRWVLSRDDCDYIPDDQNSEHGTLVASLIANAKGLNHGHPGFPSTKAKIVDVVAMPGHGQVGERELLDNIVRGLTRHPEVKVWNMSLNKECPCHDSAFSYFAVALDEIQDRFGVLVINSAGNYLELPAPSWPRPDLNGRDRLYQPGESLRCLTVGSLAHRERADACAKVGEPSPFSRRGPGAAFVPKPELTHIGGNTNSAYDCSQIGVMAVNGNRKLAETVGTSFAAPLVAVTASALRHSLEGNPSRHLIKALLVHSAVLNSPEIEANLLPYYGFGTPPDLSAILRCQPWEATLIFEMNLSYTDRHFHKTNFPIPPCLHRNGTVYGEIVMTMACDPPLDPREGAAYSLVNIKPAIGRCRDGDEEGEMDEFKGQVVPYPKHISQLFEAQQIRHGYKWAPIKVFRTTMRNLAVWDNWQISIKMESRNFYESMQSQPVVVIVTLRDPKRQQPVYNEVVAMMNRVGWQTQNLPIRAVSRVRVR